MLVINQEARMNLIKEKIEREVAEKAALEANNKEGNLCCFDAEWDICLEIAIAWGVDNENSTYLLEF